jgi:hypothetical protein
MYSSADEVENEEPEYKLLTENCSTVEWDEVINCIDDLIDSLIELLSI